MNTEISPQEAINCLVEGVRLTLKEGVVRKQVTKGIVLNGLFFLVLLIGVLWGAWALTGLLIGDVWYAAVFGWLARICVMGGVLFLSPVLYALTGEIVLPGTRGKIFRFAREWAGGAEIEEVGGVMVEVKSVAMDLRRLGRFVAFSLLAMLLNLVPVVGNVAYFVIQALIAAHTMGWDILGRHFELHGLSYQQQKAYLRSHRALTITIGGVATLLCLIPVAQFFFVTSNVAGAGVLSAKLDGF